MDFKFIQNPVTKNWVISAPRRAKRPDEAKGAEPVCPFCVGREADEAEVYRVQDGKEYSNWPASNASPARQSPDGSSRMADGRSDAGWQIRVLPNKFPFAPIHEVIIHSPDHHKSFDELPLSQSELIFKTFRQRFQAHQDKGQVYIFHNHGEGAGESLPHPHSQLAVVPVHVKMNIPRLHVSSEGEFQETAHFMLSCPATSEWPDEVWVFPKKRGRLFSEITDEEIKDFAKTLYRLIQIMDLRHGHEFPFNFYIYPGGDWYLRLIPRVKSIGGFELGTGIGINTQDPKETIAFIKEHFEIPNEEKIRIEHQASYKKTV